jgi:hypothetical protein
MITMQFILRIHLTVHTIDLHLHWILIEIEYVLEIASNFVLGMNHMLVRNIGIIIINKIIVLIVFQGPYLITVVRIFVFLYFLEKRTVLT